ncbi:hypothetical protein STXM2123_2778 [Streptomyces sp. F-3]|uniref:Integral membrane protein n=1 Tax=Streptomyces thermogriseus TaxID=75292 RepID=A0ABP4DRP8_9ACTN|nr:MULTISPECIES: hypothetical protein [unclassified Streptomyces]MDN5384323.1 hypothetical protein [Streptomyces sp. LB8]GAT82077.1 hypothetical protein STXM2123_2778 [Streptomyces sp. F-3]
MLRHEFQPGRLVAGLFFTGAGVLYAGDAYGAWRTPWFVVFPLVLAGLCLAGATGVMARAVRRRRDRRTAAAPEGAGTAEGAG